MAHWDVSGTTALQLQIDVIAVTCRQCHMTLVNPSVLAKKNSRQFTINSMKIMIHTFETRSRAQASEIQQSCLSKDRTLEGLSPSGQLLHGIKVYLVWELPASLTLVLAKRYHCGTTAKLMRVRLVSSADPYLFHLLEVSRLTCRYFDAY